VQKGSENPGEFSVEIFSDYQHYRKRLSLQNNRRVVSFAALLRFSLSGTVIAQPPPIARRVR
jgi:hypothetical protein